jgi:hypothetical protein
LRFEHDLPLTGRFSFRDAAETGDASTTVTDIKARLRGRGGWTALPTILELQYLGVSLAGDRPFVAYGIPAGTAVTVEFRPSRLLKLTDRGVAQNCYFSAADTAGDLRAFLARRWGCRCETVVLASGGAAVADADALAGLAAFGLEADAAVPSYPALPVVPLVPFRFGQRAVQIALDRSRPVAELRPLIARALGVEGAIAVLSCGSELDDEMPLTDAAGDLPDLEVRRVAVAEASLTFQVMLLVGGASTVTTCTLPRAATLAAVEDDLRRRALVAPENRLDFAIDEALAAMLPKTARIDGLDLRQCILRARIGADAVAVAAVADAVAVAAAVPARAARRRASARASPAGGPTVAVNFVLAGPEPEPFALELSPMQTVRDMKRSVLSDLGRPEDTVIEVLFAGKALRDDFILERLRIGSDTVFVYLKADKKFLLQTVVPTKRKR